MIATDPTPLPPVPTLTDEPPPHRPRRPFLFPTSVTHPFTLVGVALLPQIILTILNLQTWHLISGEVSALQRTTALALFFGECLLLIGSISLVTFLALRQRPVTRAFGLPLMFVPALYLAAATCFGPGAIPASLTTWIVPPDQWLGRQFVFVAPTVLYGALRFACPSRETPEASLTFGVLGVLLLTGVMIGLGVFGSVMASFVSTVAPAFPGLATSVVVVPIALAGAICFGMMLVALILRIGLSMDSASRRSNPRALAAFTAVIAILGPIGGLILNAQIPFPADFQSPAIYAAALLNGILLTLPNFAHPLLHRAIWLGQCALFPFTAYFFVVFLPWLPLTPVAICFLGFGLLMVVPPLLFIIHGARILDGFAAEVRGGNGVGPAILALTAILAWPFVFTLSARADRAALHEALDYLTYPDYAEAAPFEGDLTALERSLRNLRKFKTGIYLPLLSEYQNWLTFDNLVLPDDQLDALETTFFGEVTPVESLENPNHGFGFATRDNRRLASRVLDSPNGERPSTHAVTQSITTQPIPGGIRATMKFHNPTTEITEYQTASTFQPTPRSPTSTSRSGQTAFPAISSKSGPRSGFTVRSPKPGPFPATPPS
ncbi:MAG: MSEP-CTERM sorting domain-containing protein [Chthoniobacterales bacterium]